MNASLSDAEYKLVCIIVNKAWDKSRKKVTKGFAQTASLWAIQVAMLGGFKKNTPFRPLSLKLFL